MCPPHCYRSQRETKPINRCNRYQSQQESNFMYVSQCQQSKNKIKSLKYMTHIKTRTGKKSMYMSQCRRLRDQINWLLVCRSCRK
jgi:hypothetical protein